MNALSVMCCFLTLKTTLAWNDVETFIQDLVKHYDPMTTTIVYSQDDDIDHVVCKGLHASCVGYNQHGLEEVANKLNDLRAEGYAAPLLFSDGNHQPVDCPPRQQKAQQESQALETKTWAAT